MALGSDIVLKVKRKNTVRNRVRNRVRSPISHSVVCKMGGLSLILQAGRFGLP
jgi:hypothetical protein